MSISLLNFGMLAGLLGVTIPVLVHLLNRRRFDVVPWGAMQFLQLGERTRQRIKLSDLLLLLLRMSLVALLVFAFTRPFVKGSTWIRSLHPEPVDLVLIIDGSYSMGWTGEPQTPHARAIQVCHEILDDLTSVDRVAIIDARSRPFLMTPAPLTDTANARLELEKIQRPDGSANLVSALTQACQLLTQSFSTRREILVLTDKQQSSWKLAESAQWNEMLRLRHAAAVPIQITALDVGLPLMEQLENFQVEQLQLSRELAVVQTPVTATTRVKYVGPLEETSCELFWSVDGQQLSRETRSLQLRRGEQTVVQFTTRFSDPGSHVITASVTPDSLPGDDTATSIVQILGEIPALIAINGGDPAQPIPSGANHTPGTEYYLKLAFGNPDLGKVWVKASVRDLSTLDTPLLQNYRILFLTGNVPADFNWQPLTEFLIQGGAIVVLPAAASRVESWQAFTDWQWNGQVVPPLLFSERVEHAEQVEPEKLDSSSLSGAWLDRIKQTSDSDLADALFRLYWRLKPAPLLPAPADSSTANEPAVLSPVTIDARLQSGEPLFARRFVGRGQVLISAVPWDGEQNDLVRLRSFVPFVHELVFGLTRTTSSRNVELGQPLLVSQLPCQPLVIPVIGPDGGQETAQRSGSGEQIRWILAPPRLSGIYRFQPDCRVDNKGIPGETDMPFSVHASREESQLVRLTAEESQHLAQSYGLRWKQDSRAMLADLASTSTGIEIWPLLLFVVTAMLLLELLLTRKLVQGGHAQIDLP
ncbi:MAG: BatA domain-containing protein [Planctomycetaceae bacterium]|nr:BatA domain-containing protein [Planctomycetaceae bacterium]